MNPDVTTFLWWGAYVLGIGIQMVSIYKSVRYIRASRARQREMLRTTPAQPGKVTP